MSNFVLTPNAVAKLRRAIAPRSGNGGAVAAKGLSIDLDKFPPPFTVRWSQSENSGVGAWVIWLPDLSKLVLRGEEYADDIDGVTASDTLPAGWYTIDDLQSDSESVYLVAHIPDDEGEEGESGGDPPTVTVELSGEEGQATTGETVVNLLVAEMEVDTTSGARRVKQYVTSPVLLAKKSDTVEPDDVSTEFIPEPPSGTTPTGDEGKLQIKGFQDCDPESASTLGANLSDSSSASSNGHVLCRNPNGELEYKPIGKVVVDQIQPDDVSTEFIPDAPSGSTPTGDEGKLQIKGFNSGTPADTNDIAQYLQGAAQLPSAGLFLVARAGASAGGSPTLVYIPISTIFTEEGADIEVEFVADNDWDSTNHILRKRLRVLNLRTGAVTDKDNTTYDDGWEVMAQTTGISTILSQQSGSGS